MKSREDAQREVRLGVHQRMAVLGWNKADLQAAAGIDANTAGDFLNGRRWPQARTLSKIEKALDWPPGAIAGAMQGMALQDIMEEAALVSSAGELPPAEEPIRNYVAAPGERVTSGAASDSDVNAMIREMAELVREMRLENRELRERLARLEGKGEG